MPLLVNPSVVGVRSGSGPALGASGGGRECFASADTPAAGAPAPGGSDDPTRPSSTCAAARAELRSSSPRRRRSGSDTARYIAEAVCWRGPRAARSRPVCGYRRPGHRCGADNPGARARAASGVGIRPVLQDEPSPGRGRRRLRVMRGWRSASPIVFRVRRGCGWTQEPSPR